MILNCHLLSLRRVAIELAASAMFLLCAVNAHAQSSRVGATLEGIVSDTTGAVIPSTKVSLHNPLTNQSRRSALMGKVSFGQSSLLSVLTKLAWNKQGSHPIGTRASS